MSHNSKTLFNAGKIAVPSAILDQHLLAIGKSGSGKSSKLRVLVEWLLRQQEEGLPRRPVCILDPKGDWYGLKLDRKGKGLGYPIVIFGGPHADVPITATAGKVVAEFVASGQHDCLIDFRGWMPGDRSKFFIDFASTLFNLQHPRMWLVMEEVHNFAPQGKVLDPMAGKCLHWANRLQNEGRSLGITILSASQRPQKVHKDFVTACETLIACRVIHELDRNAVADWMLGAGDKLMANTILGELASMPRDEAWVWSPEIQFGPIRTKFPMFDTFDSFRPRDEHENLELPKPLNLEQIRQYMKDIVAKAEQDDPELLKKRITTLEKELRQKN
jgi:hypothetical protein